MGLQEMWLVCHDELDEAQRMPGLQGLVQEAGLMEDDIILKVDGKEIDCTKDIKKVISKKRGDLKILDQKNVKKTLTKNSRAKNIRENPYKKSRAKIQGKLLTKISGKNIRENH